MVFKCVIEIVIGFEGELCCIVVMVGVCVYLVFLWNDYCYWFIDYFLFEGGVFGFFDDGVVGIVVGFGVVFDFFDD